MERGPVPPHERTWRHPSELAAEERALVRATPANRTTRIAAMAVGSVGLLAIAVLVVSITPNDQGSPVAIDASTTLLRGVPIGTPRAGSNGSVESTTVALGLTSPSSSPAAGTTPAALATPIGDGTLAIVTTQSLGGQRSGTIALRLQSGVTDTGEIVAEFADTTVVQLASAQTAHNVAARHPSSSELVTIMSAIPMTVAFHDIDGLDVPEGTPVIDGRGDLVGLCSRRDDGTTMVLDLDDAVGTVTPSSSTSTTIVTTTGASTTTIVAATVTPATSSTTPASTTITTVTSTTVASATSTTMGTTTTIATTSTSSTTTDPSTTTTTTGATVTTARASSTTTGS